MYRTHLIVFIISFFVSCKKDPTLIKIENLNQNKISVFGHGGLGILSKYPMNSMESLTGALKLGAAGTEMDVQLSKDNVLVLYHNLKLEDATHCYGDIREKNWDEIKNCKYKLPLFSRAALINANQVFEKVENKSNYIFTFDCKVNIKDNTDFLMNYANALYMLISNNNLLENCFIESYNVEFLKILYLKNNKLKLFIHADDYKAAFNASKYVTLYGITMDRERITKEEIEEAHKQNLHVTLFNTDSEKTNLEAIQMNPDFIQTDKVEYLVNVLKKE